MGLISDIEKARQELADHVILIGCVPNQLQKRDCITAPSTLVTQWHDGVKDSTVPMDGVAFIYLPAEGQPPAENGKPYEMTLVFNEALSKVPGFGQLESKLLQAAPLNPSQPAPSPKPVKANPLNPDSSINWVKIASFVAGALGVLMLIVAGLAAAAFLGVPLIAAFVAGTALAQFVLHISIGALVLTALSFTALGFLTCPSRNP